LKSQYRRRKDTQFIDPEFLEALEESISNSRVDRHSQRRAWQFCRQVQRALNLALADENLFVDEVSPAPDCGRLLVRVFVPDDRPVAEVIDALRRESPRLRAEVASAITRKRAPELSFVPAVPDGGDHA